MEAGHVVMRPQTLAEVARIAKGAPADFYMALDEFADEFYLDHPDKTAQQRRIDPVPDAIGDPLFDTLVGAAGEHLARRWGLRIPDWTRRPLHFGLDEPRWLPDVKTQSIRDRFVVESPPAFRSRRIFTGAEPFQRARFPRE